MSIESSDDSGADTFWPGYVDAVTNLVLNLLFVLVIMIVAVFMFAMELGRRQSEKVIPAQTQEPITTPAEKPPVAANETEQQLREQIAQLKAQKQETDSLKKQVEAKQQETEKLKQQLENLKAQAAPVASADGENKPKTEVQATVKAAEPDKTLEKLGGNGGVVVNFVNDAIALTPEELTQVRNALGSISASGGAKLTVRVPEGFSEAKRLGFYRAMAVRNVLIELKVPANQIDVSIKEVKGNADGSKVRVSPK